MIEDSLVSEPVSYPIENISDLAQIASVVEVFLLTSETPLNESDLIALLDDQISQETIQESLYLLKERWNNRGLELIEVEKGWRFQTHLRYQIYINKLYPIVTPRYSRAVWETLAVIVYRQPVTRAEIEEIRGVSISSHVIKTLENRGWVHVIGRKEVIGYPALYATTYQFLSDFSLKSLTDLPKLEELGTFLESFNDVSSEKTPLFS